MAKRITQTAKLRKSLKQKIYRLNKQGVYTGTLKQDINEMSLKDLRRLASQKGGKSTFSGLYKYLEEEPMRDYYRDNDRQGQLDDEIPEIDEGLNYYYSVLDMFQSYFGAPIPEERQGKGGKLIRRPASEMQASAHAQNFLMDLFYTKAAEEGLYHEEEHSEAEEGFSEMGARMQADAEKISNDIAIVLTGYVEDVERSMHELATIINGGTLSSAQYQEFSDFADTFMGDDMDM